MKTIVKRIRIIGITTLNVNTEVDDLEAFRKECAQSYKVRLSDVKFTYEERD